MLLTFLFLITNVFEQKLLAKEPCGPNSHWVRAHHRRGYIRYDGTIVSPTNVRAHCQGNPPGFEYWRPKLNDDRPTNWPYNDEISKKWTDEEIERVIEALEILPSSFIDFEKLRLYRMASSKTSSENPATSAKNIVVLYDSAFKQNRNLTRILGHEFAHHEFDRMAPKLKRSYSEETGWNQINDDSSEDAYKEGRNWINSRSKFVEIDGKGSPSEDFANNIEYFMFNPTKLQLITPSAYDWIKNHLNDKIKLKSAKKENL